MSDKESQIQRKVAGAKGGAGAIIIFLILFALIGGGVFLGYQIREPFLDLMYDLIGLDDSQLHHKQAPIKQPDRLEMN